MNNNKLDEILWNHSLGEERCESCGAIFEIDGPTAWCEDPTGCGAYSNEQEEQGIDYECFDENEELNFEDEKT